MKTFSMGVALLAAALFSQPVQAGLITGWSITSGSAPLTGASTASPTLGDGSPNSADNSSLAASFPSITLAIPGDTITLTGSVTMSGITVSSQQFRLALFDGSPTAVNLSYIAAPGNGTTGQPIVWRRTSGAFSSFATTVGTGTPPGVNIADGTYDFELSITVTPASGLLINASLNDGTNEFLNLGAGLTSGPASTTVPATFSNVGFLAGGSLDADQMAFRNIDVTFTSGIPEPTTLALAALLLGCFTTCLRRRSAVATC